MRLISAMDRLDAAAAAAGALQPRRAHSGLLRGSSRRARAGRPGCRRRPRRAWPGRSPFSLSISAKAASLRSSATPRVAASSLRSATSLVSLPVGRLAALHDLQHDLLQVALAAVQRDDLGLEAGQVLRRRTPGRSRGASGRARRGCGPSRRRARPWSARGRGRSTSVSAPITCVAMPGARGRRARRSGRARAACGGGGPAGRARCRAPGQIEQSLLGCRGGFHFSSSHFAVGWSTRR